MFTRLFGMSLGVLSSIAPMAAAEPDPVMGRALAQACSSCHGQQRADADKHSIPQLENQTTAQLESKLLGYRSGALTGTVMNRIARGYGAAELRAMARAIALERRP